MSAAHASDVQRQLATLPAFPPRFQHSLVTGPVRSCKTALLFHYAHSLASRGQTVLFICHRYALPPTSPCIARTSDVTTLHFAARKVSGSWLFCRAKMEQYPPMLPQGVQHTDAAWSNVHMRYLESGRDLRRFLAGMHLVEAKNASVPGAAGVEAADAAAAPAPGADGVEERQRAQHAAGYSSEGVPPAAIIVDDLDTYSETGSMGGKRE